MANYGPNEKIKAWAQRMVEKDPDYFKKLGHKGGKNSHTGGFAANPELARIVGRKGGLAPKRRKKMEKSNDQ